MTTTALIPFQAGDSSQDRLSVQMREARASLGTIDFASALAIRAWAEAVRAAARAKKAAELAAEAAETQIRAERRLGRILTDDPTAAGDLDITPTARTRWTEVARMPERLFEKVVGEMLRRGLGCRAAAVVNRGRQISFKKVAPGIMEAWDGTHFIVTRKSNIFSGPFPSLQAASSELSKRTGSKRNWVGTGNGEKLDEAHATARKLAQSLSLLRQGLENRSGSLGYDLSRAELLVAEAAGLLYKAWVGR